ncbi:MAG TPA: sulfite exporter TauE/SafE family protein [Acidimicrobiales bacterium]|nr:sulfite exporter TauE/SafE family protein [Acidimicrobiales bacterium]
MTPIELSLVLLAVGVAAGGLGALLGLGGGFIVVPALTLVFGVNIRLAIGASIVAVIATSSGAAVAYVREHMANMRVGMFLELATTTGAVTGALVGSLLVPRVLYIVFAIVLVLSGVAVARRKRLEDRPPPPPDALADRLGLHGSYPDASRGRVVSYRVARSKAGLALMYVAGAVSGLLGVGSGVLKVPAMDLAMGLPIKVSTATSNFMIGVTAAASAGVYFARGDIDPLITAPVAVGVLVGALVGSRVLTGMDPRRLRLLFAVVVLVVAVDMVVKGVA